MNEWEQELNEKKFECNEYQCEIKRHPTMKHLCGYVKLPDYHSLYGVGYDELYEKDIHINVHGGLTYAEKEGDRWVFGFDCAHYGDVVPSLLDYGVPVSDEIYRNMEYVEDEIRTLAAQLKELE